MCCSKGSQPSQTVVQQQSSQPWGGQIPYLAGGQNAFGGRVEGVMPLAYEAYKQNPSFNPFPGEWVAGQTPETLAAYGLTTNRALTGSPVMNAAQGDLTKTLTGDYLDPAKNPGFQTMVDRVKAQVMPGVSSAFSNSGDGGGLKARAMGLGLGDAIGSLAYQNYGDERNRMMQANLFAPQAAQADYYDAAQLGNVGAAKEGYQQQLIDAAMAKYQQQQQAPWGPLALYAGNVSGNYGGTTTGSSTTQLPAPNPWSQALGIGMQGLGLLGMFGAFSDERLKEDIKRVGETDEGIPLYTYRYKWGGPTQVGTMAQDLIATQPEAVNNVGGVLMVDYDKVR